MEKRAADRRIRKTKALLRQAFTSMLEERSIKDISVRELTDFADINRGTFYKHYRDIYDLAEQIENEMFDEFLTVMDSFSNCAPQEGITPILRDVFRFINKNADMCTVLLGSGGDNSFLERLKEAVNNRVLEEWGERYGLNSVPSRDYCMCFLVEGCVGLLRRWVKNGRKESPEEMAGLAAQLIVHGVEQIRSKK